MDVLRWFYIKEGSLDLRCEALPVGVMVVGERSEVRLLLMVVLMLKEMSIGR